MPRDFKQEASARQFQTPKGDHWHSYENSTMVIEAGIVNGKLEVVFKNGARYRYDTTETHCCQMQFATSVGSYFDSNVKRGGYGYARIG